MPRNRRKSRALIRTNAHYSPLGVRTGDARSFDLRLFRARRQGVFAVKDAMRRASEDAECANLGRLRTFDDNERAQWRTRMRIRRM